MKKRILIVDDSALARRPTRKILEELGHEVDEAPGGEEALEKYALGQYDLVVVDMLMAGMYGQEVLEKLKQLSPSQQIIVATADVQRSTRQSVQIAGASAMINKPVNKEEVVEILDLIWKGEAAWN